MSNAALDEARRPKQLVSDVFVLMQPLVLGYFEHLAGCCSNSPNILKAVEILESIWNLFSTRRKPRDRVRRCRMRLRGISKSLSRVKHEPAAEIFHLEFYSLFLRYLVIESKIRIHPHSPLAKLWTRISSY